MGEKLLTDKEIIIFDKRSEENKSRHTISIIYNGLSYKLKEWYIDDQNEYSKESYIIDEKQKEIYSLLFQK